MITFLSLEVIQRGGRRPLLNMDRSHQYRGRKSSVPVARVLEMKAVGKGPSAIAAELGISRMSVHRALGSAK